MLDVFTSAMCAEPWSRLGFACALIEVSAEKELKQEVIIAIAIVDGERQTMEGMKVEYEWTPASVVVQNDGFTLVQNHKKNGKKVAQKADGFKVNKPQNNFVWNAKNTKKGSVKPTESALKIVDNNSFDALQNNEDEYNANDVGESSRGKEGSTDLNSSSGDKDHNEDSESEVEETYNEYDELISGNKGARTLSQSGRDGMLKKLDHIMGNLEFSNNFQGAYAIFHPYRISDHSPAVLKIPSLSLTNLKPLKFCNFLSHKGNSLGVVSKGWNTTVDGHSMFPIKLDEIQKAIDRDPANGSLRDKEAAYIKAFNEAKIDEERFLRQKAKIDWLEVGDSNSAYFHKSIKDRNQRSRIDVVITSNNMVVTSLYVADAFVSHYESFIGANIESDLDVFQKL
nr:hypothetical protein [Tanacetum cinerariifolium]